MTAPAASPSRVRLDVWLDVACLFRTRSEAQKACKGGKVDLNGRGAKPHREVTAGDEIAIARPFGRKQRVRILAIADTSVSKARARALYHDLTPPPTPEEIEVRRMIRLSRPFTRPAGAGAPDKRERRMLRKLKGR